MKIFENIKTGRKLCISWFLVAMVVFMLCVLPYCKGNNEDEIRSYKESVPMINQPTGENTNAQPAMINKSPTQTGKEFSWVVPGGWEEVSSPSSMRLATFLVEKGSDGTGGVTCTIIPIKGTAGGLADNVQRWLSQLEITLPPDFTIAAFIAKQPIYKTMGNYSLTIVDFTTLQEKSEPEIVSMIVGVITVDDTTLFVKMIGDPHGVKKNKEQLISLCRSI